MIPLIATLALQTSCHPSASPPSSCATGSVDGGPVTVSTASGCLPLVNARVRRGGVWAKNATIEVEPLPAGGARARIVSQGGPFEALAFDVSNVPGKAMLQEGYQSWSFSGATVIPAAVPLASDGEPEFAVAATGDSQGEVVGVSYGVAVFANTDENAIVIGATSAMRATTGIAARRDGSTTTVTVMYGASRESVTADLDGTARSEWVYFGAGDTNAILAALREQMTAALPDGSVPAKRPAGGWFSWNEAFADIDAGYILAEAAMAAETLGPVGLPILEIDDGWENAWGDWQTSSTFGTSLLDLGPLLVSNGQTPGVWLAPFVVDVASNLGQSIDMSLLVHAEDGGPLVHTPPGTSKNLYVLDGTNPAAMAIPADAMKALAAAGFGLFKIDYLYAGALPGVRSQAVTGTEALRAGLTALRQAVGPGAVVNACGSPILPVLGEVDSLRIGSDTAFAAVPLSWGFVSFAARNLAARGWLAPLVWPDADQTQVRPPYTAGEAQVSATVAALAGPAYSLGDDIVTLDPARLQIALNPALLDIAGASTAPEPVGVFANPAATVAVAPLIDTILGHGDTYAPPPATFHVVGRSGTSYTINFTWTGNHGVVIR